MMLARDGLADTVGEVVTPHPPLYRQQARYDALPPQNDGSRDQLMGRFATTVSLYEELRPPYPVEFFRTVAEKLRFSKQHALIDLGTGPGLLALGFAPYVGRIVGVDPEPAMLAVAGRPPNDARRTSP